MEEVIREKDKGVSAIVGTILIVAITVVLAATVYGVLTGFGGLIGNTAPTASMSVSSTGSGATSVYTLSFNSVSSSNIKLSDLQLKLTQTGGTVVTSTALNAPTASGYTITYANTTGGSTLTISTVITVSGPALSAIALIDTNPSGTVATWSA